MATELGSLQFNYEWESGAGITTPELRETWSRLSIEIDGEPLTLISDARTRSTRGAIHVPLYPLAEWIAFNWWFLRAHSRPSFLPVGERNVESSRASKAPREWLQHHNLRMIGDGIPWPDISLIPCEGWLEVTSRGYKSVELEYLRTKTKPIDRSEALEALGNLVQDVIDRLRDSGLHETELEKEWGFVRTSDPEEVEFSETAARLGLDPSNLADEVSQLIIEAAGQLDESLLEDFLLSASPTSIEEDLRWTEEALAAAKSTEPGLEVEALPRIDKSPLYRREPWTTGYQDARSVRSALSLGPNDLFDPSRYIASDLKQRELWNIRALGARSDAGTPALVSARQSSRFVQSRALWRFISSAESFIISDASTAIQKAERAFAAELLAPSEGLATAVRKLDQALAPLEFIGELAHEYDVHEAVIQHQLENHFNVYSEVD